MFESERVEEDEDELQDAAMPPLPDAVAAGFAAMSKDERLAILTDLLSRYCPECGDTHETCGEECGLVAPDFEG